MKILVVLLWVALAVGSGCSRADDMAVATGATKELNEAQAKALEDGRAASIRLDWEAAKILLRPVAEQGVAEAQFDLAMAVHGAGSGGDKAEQEAMKWMAKAARQGHTEAQYFYGGMLSQQATTPAQIQEAISWLERAAAQGNDNAPLWLSTWLRAE